VEAAAVLTIMKFKLPAVAAAAVGMWSTRERCPSAASYPRPPRRARRCHHFIWLGRYRRLSRDYEFRVQASETMVDVAATRLILSRIAPA